MHHAGCRERKPVDYNENHKERVTVDENQPQKKRWVSLL